MSTAALLLIAGLFGVYAVTAAVIFGVGLQRLLPRLAVAHMENTYWFPFVRLANNASLVLGAGAFAILFHDLLTSLLDDNTGAITVLIVALAMRLITRCYRAMRPQKAQPAVLSSLEAALQFVAPMSVAAIGVYCLVGHGFWLSLSGWSSMVLAALLLAAGGCSFLYWKAGSAAAQTVQSASRFMIAVYSLAAAVAIQVVVRTDSPHLLSWSFAIFIVLVACTLLWQGALFTTRRADHGIWWYVALLLFTTPLLGALANRPWVVYGQFTIDQGYGGLYGSAIGIGVVALTAVAVVTMMPWILSVSRRK
jgi:hypothetical protein